MMNRVRLMIVMLVIGLGVLWPFYHPASANAIAVGYFYEALLDTDDNMATGGEVGVVQGMETPHLEPGIDYIVRAYANVMTPIRGESPMRAVVGDLYVYKIVVLRWNDAGVFEMVNEEDTLYPVGMGTGMDGANVVEFGAMRSSLGFPQSPIRTLYHASMPSPPIPNDYTAAFYFFPVVKPIPTLSEWGMIVFGVLLALSTLWFITKRKRSLGSMFLIFLIIAGAIGFAWAATIMLDGQTGDWTGLAPRVMDVQGDSSIGDPNEDILYGFVTADNQNIYFRVDISSDMDAMPPP